MKILRRLVPNKSFAKKSVLTIGVFDGMHRGHARLVRRVLGEARRRGCPAVVVTFFPHPIHVLRPQLYCPLILSLEHRLKLLAESGVDICLVVPFSPSFARISPEKFIRRYLVAAFHPAAVIVGDDFRFGKERRGTLATFRQAAEDFGFKFHAVKTRVKGCKYFGSARIRKYVLEGQLQQAVRLLGRPVALWGEVVHGDTIGRGMGYPTANINPREELLPPSGIYAAQVRWHARTYRALAYIGRRPTFKKIGEVRVEVHLLDFYHNLYGQKILIEFLKKIRDDKTFSSQNELAAQIKKDERFARRWFSRRR